jgi:hypothetical protein
MDKKITDLASVSAPLGADLLPIVHSGDTMKVDLTTLMSKIPGNLGYAGIQTHTGTPQTMSAAGAVSLLTEFSYIDNQSGSAMAVTLANGTHGQVKTIVCRGATATTTLTATQSGFTNVQFTALHQTVTLKYLTDKWYIISYYGVTTN